MKKNVFLIGPMAAGKSTIGKQLAKKLGYDWVDIDQEIQRRTGVTLKWIVDQEGEKGFARREHELVKELVQRESLVISTAADTVVNPLNRPLLQEHGVIVYLKVSLPKQVQRTAKDRVRPQLETEDKEQRLKELAQDRTVLYQSLAEIELYTDKNKISPLVQKILSMLEDYWQDPEAS
ncbi:MAG: shikimate kinase [Gammaproteobacteria bacterium]|nr:shikimate kinase [Gammaproteobacteria bacterium]